MTLLNGHDGQLKIGPTDHLTTIGFISTVTIQTSRERQTRGPYIGNNTKYSTQDAKTSTVQMTGDIPATRDGGQAKLVQLYEAGTYVRLYAKVDDGTQGYEYTAANFGIDELSIEGDAATGWTFNANGGDMDGYTLVQTP